MLPLLAPIVTVVVITVIGYGGMRFRIALDVILPILAAAAIERYLSRRDHARDVAPPLDEPALAAR
jgi:hypothetical protein